MRRPEKTLLLGGAMAAAAALFLGSALLRALTVEPPAPPPSDEVVVPEAGAAPAPSDGEVREETSPASVRGEAVGAAPIRKRPELALGMDALMLAVESDPFQPDRKRHPDRYLLPGERAEDVPPADPPPPPPFRVVGTAMSPAGALALVQVEDRPPRVLAVGESLLGYVLERVDGEFATLTGAERSITLPVTKMVLADASEGRGRGERGRNARGQRQGEERMREEVRTRQAEILELLREQIRQRGGDQGEVRFDFQEFQLPAWRLQGRGRGGGEGEVMYFESGAVTRPGRGGITVIRRPDMQVDTMPARN